MAVADIDMQEKQGKLLRLGAGIGLPLAAFVLVAGALNLLSHTMLNDPDVYWHLAIGQWILSHGFPHADTFSSTYAGVHWIAKEWLSQIGFSAAYAVAGWSGMVALSVATIALTFAILVRVLSERLGPVAVCIVAACGFAVTAPHMIVRPHVIAFPVMVLFVAGLVHAVDTRRAPSYWLLPLMALWANLHGGFTLGIVIAGGLGLEALVQAPAAERWRIFFVWLRFGLLLLVAACITPYGPESAVVTARILGLGAGLQTISEWRPPDLAHLGSLKLILLLGTWLALRNGFRVPPMRLLVLIGILHLALSASRNAELLGLLGPLLLMKPLAEAVPEFFRRKPQAIAPDRRSAWILAALVVALIPVDFALAVQRHWMPPSNITPTAALDAAKKAAGNGVIFNSYDFGGYMIANGVKTFIDGRAELFGTDFLLRYNDAALLKNLPDLLAMLNQYKVEATLLPPQLPAVALLDRTPGWRRVYSDATAVVHVRDLRPTQ